MPPGESGKLTKKVIMNLKERIRAMATSPQATYPQNGYLMGLTGLKFWQTETMPPPSREQAGELISACLHYIETRENGMELLEAIQIWFPSFSDLSEVRQRKRYGRKKSEEDTSLPEEGKDTPPKPEPEQKKTPKAPEPKPEPKQKPEPEPEPKPEPKPTQPAKPARKVFGAELLQGMIQAGIKNLWMVGPAGCGKTTICQNVGIENDLPVTVIPCGAGTSATTFLGYKYPEREETPFVSAFSQPGIIVLDEFTALEPQVAQIVNGALANNELSATTGTFSRNPECVIIATSNTFGHGADRMYVSNNQLDSSTIDRFSGGIIEVDYSREYESQYDKEVCEYVWRLREVIQRNGLRKLASTRAIIAGEQLKKAGLDWKSILVQNWSEDEKMML